MTPNFKEQLGCEGSMSQHDTLTLEPCPFCGGQPELEDCRTIWVVRCKCEACVLGKRAPEPDGSETDEYWQGIRQTAIDAWNRRAALSATQPAQAKQPEPAEHWHRLYLEKCQQYNDRVAQLGGVIEGLEAEAAQGAADQEAVIALAQRMARTAGKCRPSIMVHASYMLMQCAAMVGQPDAFIDWKIKMEAKK